MTQILKQSTAVDVLIGPFVDSTNGYTAETGVSPAVKLSKNGQALATKSDVTTPLHDADGYYNCELDATDTNTVGTLVLSVVGSATSLAVRHEYQVIEEAVYDALYAASAAGPLQSTVAGRTLDVSVGGEAGVDWANVGSPTTAVDLSGTDIQLCDTVTTNTDMVGTDNALLAANVPANFADLDITASTGRVDIGSISGDIFAASNIKLLFDDNEGFYVAYAGPRGPGIYINDAAANTNTLNGEDGTISNPVSTITAAKTLADSMSIDRFYLVNNTSITLAATMQEYEFIGLGDSEVQVINLGDQTVTSSAFYNVLIEGDCAALSGRFYMENCIIADEGGAGTTTVHAYAVRCGFLDSFLVTDNDDHIFDQCYSMAAGNGTPTIDLDSGANVDVSIRHYSGGIQIDNASATATMSLETDGQAVIDATCNSAFALTIRGNCSITDNATLSSLTDDAVYNEGQINAQVEDVVGVDTIPELGVGVPATTPTMKTAMMLQYMALRNTVNVKTSTTTDAMEVSNNAGTVIAHKDVTDDGSDYSEATMQSGATT